MQEEIVQNATQQIVYGLPILVIDDDPNDTQNMRDEILDLEDLGFTFDNVKFFNDPNEFEKEAIKHNEAILISDFDMELDGVELLSYVTKPHYEKEYHLFIYTAHLKDPPVAEKLESFNGRAYSKTADFSDVLMKIHELLEPYYSNIYSDLSGDSEPNSQIKSHWDDIVEQIVEELNVLAEKDGQFYFANKSYSYSEILNEVMDTDSELGKSFILSYIHGSIMHRDFLKNLK